MGHEELKCFQKQGRPQGIIVFVICLKLLCVAVVQDLWRDEKIVSGRSLVAQGSRSLVLAFGLLLLLLFLLSLLLFSHYYYDYYCFFVVMRGFQVHGLHGRALFAATGEIFYGHQTLVEAAVHPDILEFTYQAA